VSVAFPSANLFWGFKKIRTGHGKYNLADPEKALCDWVYLWRRVGGTINNDELDLNRLDQGKLLSYASEFPGPVKRQIREVIATLGTGQNANPPLH
jgi:hypothetical protein